MWVDIVETVQSDVKTVNELCAQLADKQNARLRVTFESNEAELDRDIENVAARISQLLKKCENGVKRVATVANERGTSLPEKERLVRLNVMRALGADLQELSKKYKKSRKTFLGRVKGQEEVGKEFFSDDSKTGPSLDEALDRGLSEEEIQQLTLMNENATVREREIINIATSINDLANLFNELSVLVVEQGTVLDRIDYNVEQTLHKVEEGVKELQVADDHSKKAYTMKLILCLLFVVIILTLVLIFKHTTFKKTPPAP